jgi:O-antigen/teichoic acid export membrane protein
MSINKSGSVLIARNAVFSVLSWMLPLGLSLLVTPVIVGALGNAAFGIYALFLGIIGYSFTFGIGKAAGKYVAQFKAAGEYKALSEAVTAVLISSVVLGLMAALVFWAFAGPIVTHILLIPPEGFDPAVRGFYLAGVIIFFTMISLVYQNVLQGIQRFDRLALLTGLSTLVLNGGAAVVAVWSRSVETLLLWNLASVALMALLFFVNARRLLPELRFDLNIRPEIKKKVGYYAGSIILYQLAGNILFLFERSLIVRELGPAALTFYAIPLSFAVHFLSFAAGISLAVFPAANALLGDGRRSILLYRVSTKILVAASVFFFLSAIILGRQFLGIWLGSEFSEHSHLVLVLHSGTFAIMGATIIAWQFSESSEKFGINAAFTAVSSAIAAVLMLYSYKLYGLEGIAASRFLGSSLLVFLVVFFEMHVFGKLDIAFWLSLFIRLIAAAVVSGSLVYLLSNTLSEGWIFLILEAAVSFSIFSLLLWGLRYFKDEEQVIFGNVLRRLILRHKDV